MSDHRRRDDDEDLAYGDDSGASRGYGDQAGSSRSLVGDTLNKLRSRVDKYGRPTQSDPYGYGSSGGQQQQYSQSYNQPSSQGGYQQPPQSQYQSSVQSQNQPAYVGGPPQQGKPPKADLTGKIFSGIHGAVHSIGSDVAGLLGTQYGSNHHQSYTTGTQGPQGQYGPQGQGAVKNRFDSFVPEKSGNDVKWYVDGCAYMWAVSEALERARESVWILDWWLSPELYLRRPPAANEEWRLDRVLQRIANRGVKVNIIVYKEVTQALTLSSSHTKHALEALSPNIGVFRHPDHLPDAQTAQSSIWSSLQGLKLDAAGASKLGSDALKGIYGLSGGVILYWAHHEKLCLIDGNMAFMGGLDLCYGRWDTNQHSISDAHPSDLNRIVFPGQDFNNARVMDFNDVANAFQNKLDRTKSSRMGWSDISICLRGPCVQDLRHHFTDRWNFIYNEKYNVRKDIRYTRLQPVGSHSTLEGPQGTLAAGGQQSLQPGQFPPPPGSQTYTQPPWQATSATHTPPTTQPYGNRPYSPQPPTGQYGQPQQQYDSGAQGSHPPTGSYSQPQQQYGSRPHSPLPPVGQYGSGSQQTAFPPPPPGQPPQNTQQSYSPLPSGGPPQSAVQPSQPSWGGQQQYPAAQQQPQSLPAQTQSQSEYTSGYSQQAHPPQPSSIQPPSSYTPLQSHQPQYSSEYQQPSQTQYSSGYQQQPTSSQPFQAQYGSGNPQPSHLPQSQQPQYSSGYQHATQPQPSSGYTSHAQELPTSPPVYQQYGPTGAARGFEEDSGSSGTTRGFDENTDYSRNSRGIDEGSGYHGTSRGFDENTEYTADSRGLDENPNYYESEEGYERGSDRGRGSGRGHFDRYSTEGRKLGSELGAIGNMITSRVEGKVFDGAGKVFGGSYSRPQSRAGGSMQCQLIRSCTTWSNGTPTEHSIQNAYIDVIMNSQHFVYIENQFFITATGDKQGPVKNQIGKALVDRILRAARNREKYHVIVVMPAIPAFAGDFVDDSSLGTRAICEFQYFSICRGGHSIMEEIAKAGFNPMDYIRFYNLRNYDRINYSAAMIQAQAQSGIGYEDARKQQEQKLGAGYAGQGYQNYAQAQQTYGANPAQQYQGAAQSVQTSTADRWDSVASCYMLNGQDIRTVPWSGPPEAEIDSFVSEELYVHSKVMIADDRVVICGSANINDRSMLGYHDSEIALFINDPTPVQTTMAGRPYQASRFAASLRRQLIRKHLGLIPAQNFNRPDDNFLPLGPPNMYDWGSPEDRVVSDPLSDTFQSLWNTRARTNTEIFRKAFRAVPDDYVRTWAEYKEFFEYYFRKAEAEAAGKDKNARLSRVEYGHVVRDDFPGGVKELKELLSRVKGTLVEMPLCFLQNEDIAKEGLSLNALTEEVYT